MGTGILVGFHMECRVQDEQHPVPEGVAGHTDVFTVTVVLRFIIQLAVIFEEFFGVFDITSGFGDGVDDDFKHGVSHDGIVL